jgi:trimeric autotransporter adhesin
MKKSYVYLSLAASLALQVGCKGGDSIRGIDVPSTSSISNDVKKIVSVGPGINFNALTGGHSASALNPSTSLPATVYYDKSIAGTPTGPTGALKYAYLDAQGNWNIEVVDYNYGTTAACGVAATAFCIGAPNAAPTFLSQVYDIAFVPASGSTAAYPIIVYAHGNNTATGKRIRMAARNPSTGIWSITDAVAPSGIPAGVVVATADAIRGVKVLVDSAGRPHVYMHIYETTAANSRVKYTMRKSDGTWTTLANVTGAGASASLTAYNFAAAVAGVTLGVGSAAGVMCPIDGLATISIANIAGATNLAKPWLIKCTAVDANGTCSTWAGLDLSGGCAGTCFTGSGMIAGTTNSGMRVDMTLEPVTNKLVVAVHSVVAPATTAVVGYQQSGDCSALTTTAMNSQLLGGAASVGLNGIKVVASSGNTYNGNVPSVSVLATTAATATSVVVAKSVITSGASIAAFTGPFPVDAQTATQDAVGSFLLDNANGILWGSYSKLTAAGAGVVGNDIRSMTAYESDISATGVFNNQSIDQTNSVFPVTATLPLIDAGKAPNGTVGYAYFASEQPTATAAGPISRVWYGTKGGTTTAPTFGEKVVYNATQGAAATNIGQQVSLAYDASSNPLIAFQDLTTAAQGALMLGRSSTQGVTFSADRIDGGSATSNVGYFTSVAVASNGMVGISYQDQTAATLALKVATKTANGGWRRYFVDGLLATSSCVTARGGDYSKLQFTSDGKLVVAYQSFIGGIKYLRLALGVPDTTGFNVTWTCVTVDSDLQGSNSRGEGIDMVIDSSNKAHIIHQDSGASKARYVVSTSDVATAILGGGTAFSSEVVDAVGAIAPAGTYIYAMKPSIAVSGSSKVFVSYYSAADGGLYMKSKLTSSTTSFQNVAAETIEAQPSGALYLNPAGQYARLFLNQSGLPAMFYRSFENWIKFFSRES